MIFKALRLDEIGHQESEYGWKKERGTWTVSWATPKFQMLGDDELYIILYL